MSEIKDCIGVFDSGLGGLTVAKELMAIMPNENIIYFGDTAHVPYGTKSPKEIIGYVMDDMAFLSSFAPKAIVIACNTADSIAKNLVADSYDFPVFGVVEPASKVAAGISQNNRIGVVATNATISSHAYDLTIHRFNPSAEVFAIACPLLVPLVEEGRFNNGDEVVEKIVEEYLEPLKKAQIDTLVLGCTHYPLLYDVFKKKMPGVNILSSSKHAALAARDSLLQMGLLNDGPEGKREYYVSGDETSFEKQAKLFMGDLGGPVKRHKI